MLKPEQSNEIIGKYLAGLIDRRYPSRRAFCRAYLLAAGEETSSEALSNMSNRMSQIIKGRKSIQAYDLLYFAELLDVSCEQILSAGAYCVPTARRVTNYTVACSADPAEWERHVRREDKLILNADEYGKTILDYALEFGNHGLLKYLMEQNYIWFDSGDTRHYGITFGAGTSIRRREPMKIDTALQAELIHQDALRISLIALAADHGDLQMLDALRAREHPKLYIHAHFLSRSHPDLEGGFSADTLRHIASAKDEVLDYFTEPFQIPDHIDYRDGTRRTHTFLFPWISELLDLLIAANSPFAETALKKALKHNRAAYCKLCELMSSIKHDERCTSIYDPELWLRICQQDFGFYDNGSFVLFRSIKALEQTERQIDGIITNVAHTTRLPNSPILRHLAQELNESYDAIRYLGDNLKEVIT